MHYSFVVPIYGDADLAEAFCVEFERFFRSYLQTESLAGQVELLFVNDGSPDPSNQKRLENLADDFDFVKLIELSRNFGQHVAISAGYRYASGDYVGMLNVDMEDPPDQIGLLLDAIEAGEYDIVYGQRTNRSASWTVRSTSLLFNYFLVKLTGYEVPSNTATLRVMNRRFVDAYNSLSESTRYIPGLEMWMGFRKGYRPIRNRARDRGSSSYNTRKRLLMAFETIISFSDLPLRLLVLAGSTIAVIGFLLTFLLILNRLFFVDFQPGYTSTVSLIVLLSGVQILVIGLASLYVGRILKEVQQRPLFIIRSKKNV